MKTHIVRRSIFSTALIAAFLLSAVPVIPQERRFPFGNAPALPVKGGCPKPTALTLNATTPNVVNADFSPAALAIKASLNDPASDRYVIHTFQWRSEQRCCEATSAVLTVTFKANQGGRSSTSSDAGNDSFGIMHLGVTVPGSGSAIYTSWPFSAGNTVTRTWNLSGAVLNNINSTQRLSFYAQDDTRVVSATLQVSGCCLSSPRIGLAE